MYWILRYAFIIKRNLYSFFQHSRFDKIVICTDEEAMRTLSAKVFTAEQSETYFPLLLNSCHIYAPICKHSVLSLVTYVTMKSKR
jgi:hypothetical protein